MTVTIDWENLGFSYMKLPYRYIAHFKNGQWNQGELTEDATLHISESSPSLHYGQQAFEGLKAYRTKDGSVQLFRPDENAKRLQRTTIWNRWNLISSPSFDWSRRYYRGKTSRRVHFHNLCYASWKLL